jgi:hypothetical protein
MISPQTNGSDVPGIAIKAATTMRNRSQTTITVRRGYRSASPANRVPPLKVGRYVSPYVNPVSPAEDVHSQTNTDSDPRELVTRLRQRFGRPHGPEPPTTKAALKPTSFPTLTPPCFTP